MFTVDQRWKTNQEEDERQSEISTTIHICLQSPTPEQLTQPRWGRMPAPFMLPILR